MKAILVRGLCIGLVGVAGIPAPAAAPGTRPDTAPQTRVIGCESDLTRSARYRGPRCLPAPGLRLVVDGVRSAPGWIGSFSSTRLSGWAQRQVVPGGLRIVRGPGTGARRVGLFTVRPGDSPAPAGERAEVAASPASTGGRESADVWYAWSTYFPGDLHPVPSDTWNVFTQWHGNGPDHCSPNVALQVNTRPSPARIRLAVRGGSLESGSCTPPVVRTWDPVVLELKRWHDFALHVRWSSDPGRGFVELAVDGAVVVPRTTLPTLYTGQGVYLKQGFYRRPSPETSRIYHGGVARFP
jgi:hypothetical protein